MPAIRFQSVVAAVALCFALTGHGMADDTEAAKHKAPVPVRLGFRDGTSRNVLLIAQSPFMDAKPKPQMRFRTPTGELALWMDTLVSITDIADKSTPEESSALFLVERGPPRRLLFGRFSEHVLIQNGDGTREIVDLRKIATLRAVRPASVARTE